MIFADLTLEPAEFEHRTGWSVQPEGLCRGDTCVPLPPRALTDGLLDLPVVADQLRMPLVGDPSGPYALGPPTGTAALANATAPDLVLPDLHGQPFALRSLRGHKVLLLAWASW